MKRHVTGRFTAATLLGTLALANAPAAFAQTDGAVGNARTTNEGVVSQSRIPPPVNSDARRVAEGLPVPAGATLPGGPGAGDPAARVLPLGANVAVRSGVAGYPAGMDVALLVEHALGMAIEGTGLKALAEQSMTAPDGKNATTKKLLDLAARQIDESTKLMTKAATDGANVPANSPARRFYSAASLYLANLNGLGNLSAAELAQVALINHAVKDTLDADHITQMGRVANGSHALEQLLGHAAIMKTEGTEAIMREAGNGSLDPNEPATVATLARRAREVLDAAQQLSAFHATQTTQINAPTPVGTNPARLDPERPAIIGGSLGTGSPETGTYPGPVPSTPPPTPSPGGVRPR